MDLVLAELTNVASTAELRIDPHFHILHRLVSDFFSGVTAGQTLRSPIIRDVSNGVNLPRSAYDPYEPEPSLLYASVGALSLYVLLPDECVSLKEPSSFAYPKPLDELTVRRDEVLITRSGTPGVAWPATAMLPEALAIIPSGFLIRVRVNTEYLLPGYLAAVLNHPFWRVFTAGLSAGKRQRNLSQAHLSQIMIPTLKLESQCSLAERYQKVLEQVTDTLNRDLDFMSVCDEILEANLPGLVVERLSPSSMSIDNISLLDCALSRRIRLDPRFHRSDVRAVLRPLANRSVFRLSELTQGTLVKGRQPEILAVDEGQEERVVATVSLQGGQVVFEETKPTTEDEIDRSGERRLKQGDLLIAMDGEGSIGKAAVFSGDYPAVPDSHIGIVRLKQPELAQAVACYVNSSLGQAQLFLQTSGSTGQVQLSNEDVEGLVIPREIASKAAILNSQYTDRLVEYEPRTFRARKLMIDFAAEVNEVFLETDLFSSRAREFLEAFVEPRRLHDMHRKLVPAMF